MSTGTLNCLAGKSQELEPGRPHIFFSGILGEWRVMTLPPRPGGSYWITSRTLHKKALIFAHNLNVRRMKR